MIDPSEGSIVARVETGREKVGEEETSESWSAAELVILC
jgi:hypothetical protein